MKHDSNTILRYLWLCTILCLISTVNTLFAEGIRITQIDTSELASTQRIRLFVSFDDSDIQTINPAMLSVQESSDGSSFKDVRITEILPQVTRNEGISFLLLLDNSGSMWDDLDGNPTRNSEQMRITHAKRAIQDFTTHLSAHDRAGLAVFNTNYTQKQPISSDSSAIPSHLENIEKPSRDDGYTELYGSIFNALDNFGQNGRRKVLIILSDGEHFPFREKTSGITAEDGIQTAIQKGITCYVVNFGDTKDSKAQQIARESGGLVFDARNDNDLIGIYSAIREQILNEYTIIYTASMLHGDRRFVKAQYTPREKNTIYETIRYYYSGTILGGNTSEPQWYYVLYFCVPAIIWVLLLLTKLEKPTTEAGIQLLYGAKGMQTKVFPLSNNLTVIGGSKNADITIAGNPVIKENAATIAFDKKKGSYTIAADTDLTVNNKTVTSKKLEPGDVINIAGTVVVYNDPSENGV